MLSVFWHWLDTICPFSYKLPDARITPTATTTTTTTKQEQRVAKFTFTKFRRLKRILGINVYVVISFDWVETEEKIYIKVKFKIIKVLNNQSKCCVLFNFMCKINECKFTFKSKIEMKINKVETIEIIWTWFVCLCCVRRRKARKRSRKRWWKAVESVSIEWELKTEQHSKQTLLDWFSNLSFQVIFLLLSSENN